MWVRFIACDYSSVSVAIRFGLGLELERHLASLILKTLHEMPLKTISILPNVKYWFMPIIRAFTQGCFIITIIIIIIIIIIICLFVWLFVCLFVCLIICTLLASQVFVEETNATSMMKITCKN